MKHKNAGSLKTEKLLKQLLLEQLKTRPLEKITVTSICNLAELDRSTFYLQYQDINALLESVENDLLREVEELCEELRDERLTDDYVMSAVLQFIRQRKETIRLLLLQKVAAESLGDRLTDCVHTLYLRRTLQQYNVPPNFTEEELSAMITFLTAGFYTLYKRWILQDCKEDMTRIWNDIWTMSTASLEKLLISKKGNPYEPCVSR